MRGVGSGAGVGGVKIQERTELDVKLHCLTKSVWWLTATCYLPPEAGRE